jgi:DNA topoisomerase-1
MTESLADMTDSDMRVRQRATAIYLIDHLALRVGNEKGEDEADTVGCCSLRVEHIKLKEPNIVEFDFLGKDSMRYQNTVEVAKPVFKNLKAFCKDKKKGDDIFDLLTVCLLLLSCKLMCNFRRRV